MKTPNIAIICARYYQDIVDMLEDGARQQCNDQFPTGVILRTYDVSGALEIPSAIQRIAQGSHAADGYIALGCVIRGETSHYDTVAQQSAWGLQWLSLNNGLAIANGILTVENQFQALVRADPNQFNKGAEAAIALLSLLMLPS